MYNNNEPYMDWEELLDNPYLLVIRDSWNYNRDWIEALAANEFWELFWD